MSKFKVGDRVRVLHDRASSADVRRGEQGSVEEKHGGSVVVRMDDGRNWWLDGEPGREIELVEEPNPFKKGDRVRVIDGTHPVLEGGATGTVIGPGDYPDTVRVEFDGDRYVLGGGWFRSAFEKIEPNPFKSGDRVRILTGFAKGRYGKVVTSYSNNGVSVVLDGTCGKSLYYAVDSVQYAPDQTFVLSRGDRIVNNLTGRKGHVVEGADEELWVVDETYSEETGAKASAVEEYEAHYPNTYTITRKGPF